MGQYDENGWNTFFIITVSYKFSREGSNPMAKTDGIQILLQFYHWSFKYGKTVKVLYFLYHRTL